MPTHWTRLTFFILFFSKIWKWAKLFPFLLPLAYQCCYKTQGWSLRETNFILCGLDLSKLIFLKKWYWLTCWSMKSVYSQEITSDFLLKIHPLNWLFGKQAMMYLFPIQFFFSMNIPNSSGTPQLMRVKYLLNMEMTGYTGSWVKELGVWPQSMVFCWGFP